MPLNKQEIQKLLTTSDICYIATTTPDGNPHIAPIWFVYHDGKVYFETDKTTVKFKNLQKRNKVAICFGGKHTYLVEGLVRWSKEKELNFPIRKMYWDKYGKDMEDRFINEKTLLFELIPEKTTSWHYAPSWD